MHKYAQASGFLSINSLTDYIIILSIYNNNIIRVHAYNHLYIKEFVDRNSEVCERNQFVKVIVFKAAVCITL